jgi:ABC-type lipoprotein release transport system permease subunit
MRVSSGATLALMGQAYDASIASGLYVVKGKLKSEIELINRAGIVMALSAAQDFLAMNDEVHEFAIHVDSPVLVGQVMESLKKVPELSKYEILDWRELVPQMAAYLDLSGTMNLIILILVFLTTSAGIANTMVMATFERRHEFGMLLALGCRPMRLILILLFESIILGIVGVLIGSALGVGVVLSEMQNGVWILRLSGPSGISLAVEGLDISMDIHPVLKATDIVRGIIAVMVTSALATLWPARKVLTLEPVEAMRT